MEAKHSLPDWPRHRDALRARWPKLTQGDLLAIDGDREYLLEALQMRYRIDRAAAEAETAAFVAGLRDTDGGGHAGFSQAAREAIAPGAAKIREGIADIGSGLRTLAGDTVDRGRGAVREASGEIGETARDGIHQIAERSDEVLQRAERYIRERPFTALGIAFVAGWLLLGRR